MNIKSDDTLAPREHDNTIDKIKIFSQRMAWRNGRDTAYNIKALGQRLTQKLRVLKLFQNMHSTSNIFLSHRTNHSANPEKLDVAQIKMPRASHLDPSLGPRNSLYQKKLKLLLSEHQNHLRALVSRKDSRLLVESQIIRNRGSFPNCILFQLMGAIRRSD